MFHKVTHNFSVQQGPGNSLTNLNPRIYYVTKGTGDGLEKGPSVPQKGRTYDTVKIGEQRGHNSDGLKHVGLYKEGLQK